MRRATMRDAAHVAGVLGHSDVLPFITDDSPSRYPMASAIACVRDPSIYVLMPNEYAVFIFLPRNYIMYEIHSSILPEGRGTENGSKDAANASVEWMFENTPCEKIISWVPSYNKTALHFALKCGCKEEGVIKDSYKKGGKLYDQHIVGRGK